MHRVLFASFTMLGAIHLPAPLPAQAASGGPQASIEAARLVGTFDTAVTLDRSSCTGVTVQPMPTIVTPATHDSTLVMTHAGIEHRGRIARSGAFQTTEISLGSGVTTYRVAVKGTFTSADTFTAVATVREMNGGAERCAYNVQWVGTRRK